MNFGMRKQTCKQIRQIGLFNLGMTTSLKGKTLNTNLLNSTTGKGVAPSPTPWCSKLSKREPSGHPRLWSPTLNSTKMLTLCHIPLMQKV